MSKSMKYLCLAGSLLILAVGIFHLSGLTRITSELTESNSPEFFKNIFPVLFVHVSIQLTGLAGLGIASIFFPAAMRIIAIYIAAMVAVNALLALYLDGYPPGGVLLLIAACFAAVGLGSA